MNNSKEDENQGNIYSNVNIFQANVEEGTIFQAWDMAQAKTERNNIV